MAIPQWKKLADHVMGVPERVYEGYNARDGWDNDTAFGREFGENLVPWCVIWDWCMYHDVGMDSIVPRVDNVTEFSNWAKSRGWFSEYPSIGAWVNLGNGAHTEIVVGFDADNVRTKGGNSVKAGSTDAGQGNGVWTHTTARRSSRVVGYFAPHFLDGICPPTADPHDPRGGKPVASYVWKPEPSAPAAPAFPGRDKFVLGASNIYALELQTWLQRGNWGPAYHVGPSRTMAAIDLLKVEALQQHYLSALGPADGGVGPKTWQYAYETAYGLRAK